MNNKELKHLFYFILPVVPVLSTNTWMYLYGCMDVSGVGKVCVIRFHYRKTPYIVYLTNYTTLKGKVSAEGQG